MGPKSAPPISAKAWRSQSISRASCRAEPIRTPGSVAASGQRHAFGADVVFGQHVGPLRRRERAGAVDIMEKLPGQLDEVRVVSKTQRRGDGHPEFSVALLQTDAGMRVL